MTIVIEFRNFRHLSGHFGACTALVRHLSEVVDLHAHGSMGILQLLVTLLAERAQDFSPKFHGGIHEGFMMDLRMNYIYMYIYICICIYIYMCIYIYKDEIYDG